MLVELDGDTIVSGSVNAITAEATVTITNNTEEDIYIIYPSSSQSGFVIQEFASQTLEPLDTLVFTVTPIDEPQGTYLRSFTLGTFILKVSTVVEETEFIYTSRTILERYFGKENIRIWADLNGNEDDNEIELVVFQAGSDASRILDSMLATSYYSVPFESPCPRLIQYLTSLKAGCMLYSTRGLGIESLDKLIHNREKEFLSYLDSINTGRILLEGGTSNVTTNAPVLGETDD